MAGERDAREHDAEVDARGRRRRWRMRHVLEPPLPLPAATAAGSADRSSIGVRRADAKASGVKTPLPCEARLPQTEVRGGYTCVQPMPATLPAGCEVGKGNERGSDGASERGKSILKGARPARPDGWVGPGDQSLASSRGPRKERLAVRKGEAKHAMARRERL